MVPAQSNAKGWVMRDDSRSAEHSIALFSTLNFVLAGLCALWLVLMLAAVVYGIGFSGDQGKELATGILGSVILATPGLVGLPVYLFAGLGLLRHKAWGFCFHCTGAVLAAFTCVGVIYTVLAFVFAFRPEFSAVFFHPEDQEIPRKRRKIDSWDDE
jgi:hypothetical protein